MLSIPKKKYTTCKNRGVYKQRQKLQEEKKMLEIFKNLYKNKE